MENKELTDIVDSKNRFNIDSVLDDDSDKMPRHIGYFGAYTLIKLKNKKAIVLIDSRNSIIKLITYWFDDILYGTVYNSKWDADNRWNYDKPIVVKENGLYNLVKPHSNKLLLSEWCKSIDTKWFFKKEFKFNEYAVNAIDKNDNEIIVFTDGSIMQKNICTKENIENVLKMVKNLSINEIQTLWIDKNLPCEFIRGLEYKGKQRIKIDAEKATELLKTHNNFNSDFNSAEWIVSSGQVKLLFREYADSDYD